MGVEVPGGARNDGYCLVRINFGRWCRKPMMGQRVWTLLSLVCLSAAVWQAPARQAEGEASGSGG